MFLNGDAKVEAQLQEQLVQHILLCTVRRKVVYGVLQGCVQVGAIRLPSTNVARVKPKNPKAQVASERRVLVLDPLRSASQALFGQLGDVARLAEPVTELSTRTLVLVAWIERLRKLNKHVPTRAAILRV